MPAKNPKLKFFKKSSSAESYQVSAVPPLQELDEGGQTRRKLNGMRRKRLEAIRNKENLKAKRARLCYVLIQKLRNKYGSSNIGIINQKVDDFLAAKDHVTPEELSALEAKIADAIKTKKSETKVVSEQVSHYPESDEKVTLKSERNKWLDGSIAVPPGSEWDAVNKYQSLIDEALANQKEAVLKKKRLQFKAQLDHQIRLAKDFEKKQKEDEKKYGDFVKEDVKKFKADEQAKAEKLLVKRQFAARGLRDQLIHQETLRKKESEEQARFEAHLIKIANDAVESEKAKIQAMRESEKERMNKIIAENKLNEDIKAQKRELERLETLRIISERERQMDKEEEAKAAALKKRMDQQLEIFARFEAGDGGTAAKAQKLREEQLVILEAKKREYRKVMASNID